MVANQTNNLSPTGPSHWPLYHQQQHTSKHNRAIYICFISRLVGRYFSTHLHMWIWNTKRAFWSLRMVANQTNDLSVASPSYWPLDHNNHNHRQYSNNTTTFNCFYYWLVGSEVSIDRYEIPNGSLWSLRISSLNIINQDMQIIKQQISSQRYTEQTT